MIVSGTNVSLKDCMTSGPGGEMLLDLSEATRNLQTIKFSGPKFTFLSENTAFSKYGVFP